MNPMVRGGLKLVIGIAVIGLIMWKTPLLEILTLFFYICLIPLFLISAMGLVGEGTLELVSDKYRDWKKDLGNTFEEGIKEGAEKFKRSLDTPVDVEEVKP